MKKLQLPSFSLVGTPISEEELKGIIGGMTHTRTCTCTFNQKNGEVISTSVEAETSNDCQNKCTNICNGSTSCLNSKYLFSETYGS